MRCFILTAVVLAVALAGRGAFATDRFYPDVFGVSPNGLLRFECTHPNNQLERPEPFVATGFTWRLVDVRTGAEVWRRSDQPCVGPALVHDAGHVVLGRDACQLLEPLTGKQVFEWKVRASLPSEDLRLIRDSWTSAGVMSDWAYCLHAGFVEHEDRIYHVTRTWWDRRIIIDITRRKRVKEPLPPLAAALDEADRRFVLDTLDGAADRLRPFERRERSDLDWPNYWRIRTAVHLAGRMRMQDAAPMLREVAEVGVITSSTMVGLGRRSGADPINPIERSERGFRQGAHLALRRMGERPSPLPCTRIAGQEDESNQGREVRAERIREGMTPEEVLEAIGAPDYFNEDKNAWEYDMDGEEPFSLRIRWETKGRGEGGRAVAGKVERIKPPLWQRGDERYLVLVRG